MDPLAEKAPGWSPYRYAYNNPLKFIDPDGKLEELYIISDEPGQAEAATRELQKSTSLQLTRNAETGEISATGEAKTIGDRELLKVINCADIKVVVTATSSVQTNDGNLFVGGGFLGNTVTTTESGNTVVSNQIVNPRVLGRMSRINGSPGRDMLHEVTEAYAGGNISLATGVSAGPATIVDSNNPQSVYMRAHNLAVPQSGIVVRSINPQGTEVTFSTTPYLTPIGGQPIGLQPILVIEF